MNRGNASASLLAGWIVAGLTLAIMFVGCSSGGGGGGGGGGDSQTDALIVFSSFQAASFAIGQDNLTGSSADNGGTTSASGLSTPSGGASIHNGVLFLTDSGNNRVVGYDTVPTASGAQANFAVGQANLTTSVTGTTSSRTDGVWGSYVDEAGRLFTVEASNFRMLMFNPAPSASDAAATRLLGQASYGAPVNTCTNASLSDPEGVFASGGKIIVSDRGNHRVMVWNTIPSSDGAAASLVLGQGSFTLCTHNDDDQNDVADTVTARTMFFPTAAWSDGTRLLVADSNNHRVLLWNSFPASNFTPADVVIGQSALNQNGPGTSATTLDTPLHLHSNGRQIAVVDAGNNRVLIWNSFPTAHGAAADVVLGQGSFTNKQCNDDDQNGTEDAGATGRTFCFLGNTGGVYWNGTHLYVTDKYNNRVLVFTGTKM